jgi:voltage-gated potassium channel
MADLQPDPRKRAAWRDKWHEIIFGHDTFAGQLFNIVIQASILISVLAVGLESVRSIREAYGGYLKIAEWVFTALFTIEYIARLATAQNAKRYAKSFFGIVDLLAIAPVYLSLFFGAAHSFSVVRSLRLLRIFRILKLTEYLGEATTMRIALMESLRKIVVFLFAVLTVVVIAGAMMYQIEGEAHGFTSIPAGMYWAVVTVTTVGYGDIAPQTVLGRIVASLLMIVGYGVIAVPTGIVSFEMARAASGSTSSAASPACPDCNLRSHDRDAHFCKRCGAHLPLYGQPSEPNGP